MANKFSWATSGTIQEPSQSKKDQGYVLEEFPDYRELNWILNVLFSRSGGDSIYPLTSGNIAELENRINELEERVQTLENP